MMHRLVSLRPATGRRLASVLTAGLLVCAAGVALGAEPDEKTATDDYNMAAWLYGSKKYDLAAEEFAAFLEKHPKHEKAPDARLGLARALLHQEKPKEAAAALEMLRKSHPDFDRMAVALFHLGQAYAAAGRPKEAAAAYESLVKKHGDHYLSSWSRARLGEMRLAEGEHAAAEQALAPLVERFLTGKNAKKHLKAEQERLGESAPQVARQLEPLLRRAHLNLGLARLRATQFDAARQTLEEFLSLAGKDPLAETARFYLAQSLYRLEQYDRAADEYEEIAKDSKSRLAPDAAFERALALYRAEKYEEAAKAFGQVRGRFKESPHAAKARLYEGICHYLDEDYNRAVSRLKEVGDNAEARYWLGRAYLKQEKAPEARQAFEAALSADADGPRAADALLGVADALLAQEKYDEAADAYKRFASQFGDHPDLARALYSAAASLYRAGKYEDSETFCDRFLAAAPDHDLAARVRFISGENRFLTEQYDEAAKRYQALLEQHGDSDDAPAARFRLAWVRYFDEQYDGALALLEAIDEKKAEERLLTDAAYLRGNCLMEQEKFKEAADAFKTYLDDKDAKQYRADALLKRGLAAKRAGTADDAEDALEQLLEKHGDTAMAAEAAYNLAELLAEKSPDKAADLYRRVADTHKDHRLAPYALSALADLEAKRDRRDEAIAAYGRVAEQYPDADLAPRALYRKATLLAKAGKHADARTAFEQVAEKWPDHALASDALLGLGLALEEQKAFEEAAGVFRRLIEKADDAKTREQATYELAWSLQQAGKTGEAAAAYKQLADAFPESPLAADAYFHLAEVPYREKAHAKAVPLYEKALAAGGDRLKDKVLYRLGWCRWAEKKYAEAAALFHRLVKECPESDLLAEALLQAGEAYAKAGKPAEAIPLLEKLTDETYKEFDDAAEARFRLGECQAILGRADQALRTFTEMEKAYPDYKRPATVQFQIGKALYDLKRYEPARKRFRQALAQTDTETAAKSQFYIGETYLAEDNPREALKPYLRVVALWAGYTEWAAGAQFEIGKCYQALGKPADAREAFKTVVEKYKDTKWAEPAREQLNR